MEATHNDRAPNLRHCPVCGIAMVASKSRADAKQYDVFHCLQCDAIVDLSGPAAEIGPRDK